LRVGQQANGLEHLVVVEEALAHAHEDEVGPVRQGLAASIHFVEHEGYLGENLPGGHVAPDAELSGHAEGAADGTANLAAETDRVPSLFWHKDGLGLASIPKPQQVAASAIRGVERTRNRRLTDDRFPDQPISQGACKLCHQPKVDDATVVDGAVELASPVGGLSQALHPFHQFGLGLS
jgi:hypothetical protein